LPPGELQVSLAQQAGGAASPAEEQAGGAASPASERAGARPPRRRSKGRATPATEHAGPRPPGGGAGRGRVRRAWRSGQDVVVLVNPCVVLRLLV